MKNNLTGLWCGSFIYQKGYRKLNGQIVKFEMKLEQNGFKISGTSKDKEGVCLNPDEAIVSGHFENLEISFVKQYPSIHFQDKKGNTVIDNKTQGPLIYYNGKFNELTEKFEGEWILSIRLFIFGIFPKTFIGKGTWEMKRID